MRPAAPIRPARRARPCRRRKSWKNWSSGEPGAGGCASGAVLWRRRRAAWVVEMLTTTPTSLAARLSEDLRKRCRLRRVGRGSAPPRPSNGDQQCRAADRASAAEQLSQNSSAFTPARSPRPACRGPACDLALAFPAALDMKWRVAWQDGSSDVRYARSSAAGRVAAGLVRRRARRSRSRSGAGRPDPRRRSADAPSWSAPARPRRRWRAPSRRGGRVRSKVSS